LIEAPSADTALRGAALASDATIAAVIATASAPCGHRTFDRCDCAFFIANLICDSSERASKTKSRCLNVCAADIQDSGDAGGPSMDRDVAYDAFAKVDAIRAPPTAKLCRADLSLEDSDRFCNASPRKTGAGATFAERRWRDAPCSRVGGDRRKKTHPAAVEDNAL
jgi:hypothetical protein